jgi:hypothetical protein
MELIMRAMRTSLLSIWAVRQALGRCWEWVGKLRLRGRWGRMLMLSFGWLGLGSGVGREGLWRQRFGRLLVDDEDFLVSDEILQGGCDEGKGIHSANRTTGHLTLSAMPIVLFGTLSMVLYVLEKVWEGLKWLWKVLTLG